MAMEVSTDMWKRCGNGTINIQIILEGARESAYLHQVNFYRHPLFEKNLRGHVRTVPWSMHVKFEVRSFNRFKLVWLTGLLCTDTQTDRQTDRQTDIEGKQYLAYLQHSLRSLGGYNRTNEQCSNIVTADDIYTRYFSQQFWGYLYSAQCKRRNANGATQMAG